MSHRATNWAFEQRGLKPATRVVLLYLADRHNPDLGCFPSQDQLAYDCEMSRRSVNDHLEALAELGLIRRERRVDPQTHKQMSTRYILGFEPEFTQEPSANPAHGNEQKPCANSDKSRVQNLHTNPVIEPVITTTVLAADADDPGSACLAACGPGLSHDSRILIMKTEDVIADWLEEGCDLALDVLPVIRERTASAKPRTIRTWEYFSAAVRSSRDRRLRQVTRLDRAENSPSGLRGDQTRNDCALGGPVDKAAFWAEQIKAGRYVAPTAITTLLRREMVGRGLVTEDALRARQIY
jgi:hypothetical protein